MVTIAELRNLVSLAIARDVYQLVIHERAVVHVHVQGRTLWLETGSGLPVPPRLLQPLLSCWPADNKVSILAL